MRRMFGRRHTKSREGGGTVKIETKDEDDTNREEQEKKRYQARKEFTAKVEMRDECEQWRGVFLDLFTLQLIIDLRVAPRMMCVGMRTKERDMERGSEKAPPSFRQ